MLELRDQITCLHCWSKFAPERVLWQSEHRDLLGDPMLGDEAQLRFLANRFDVNGNAIDARGQLCREIACPKCHLSLPRTILERDPLFVSILGTPTCGKSYYLAALAATLRRTLPSQFKLDITDADTVSNQVLIDYEEHLFLNAAPDKYQPLADLIMKTQEGGTLYNTVRFGDQSIAFPRPLSFTIDPASGHPNHEHKKTLRRVLCLYDNAGEHFLSGKDTRGAPGTRHMAESGYILFLFDPTQDPRWHAAMRALNPKSKMPVTPHAGRQEGVLREAALRIQRQRGMADGTKYDRPLLVILNKVDVWKPMLSKGDWKLPLKKTSYGLQAIDMSAIIDYSDRLRTLLMKHIPELVYAAESFWERVFYLPASSLGVPPKFDDKGNALIRPQDIRPTFVTIPFLLGLSLVTQGLIPKSGEPVA